MHTSTVWFRRDLRLIDNPAFHAACASGGSVQCVYVHAPDEEGQWRPGAASNWWLHHSLLSLDASLRVLGGGLWVLRGDSLPTLQHLLSVTGGDRIFWNRRYEPAVMARDTRVKQVLREQGIEVQSFNAALIVEPWQVQTLQGNPYRVFTPFWRNASARVTQCLPQALPDSISLLASARIPDVETHTVESLGLLPTIPWDQDFKAHWQPGEDGALAQLDEFLDAAVSRYSRDRDRPDCDGTSRLSPYLAWGNISPRQIVAAIHARGADDPGVVERAAAYIRELGWREFSHHLLYHFPYTVEKNLNAAFDAFPWLEPQAKLLSAWQRGKTGIPIVDAGMRELWQTGWMHNRVRMIVASLLTKNMRCHWLQGARWFWDTLVDADLANNTQGWQWTAGTGADAAPYFRVFNPVLQGERFDPEGHYVKRYVPELARVPTKHVHQPWMLKPGEQESYGIAGSVYAKPLIDLAQTRAEALGAYQASRHGPR
ncbi:MAG: deoxyribodipyrimidine photo-lyase [Pseudomonadota bacterium]|nr:deoxyribodipyrimidine photo-lyase [Pseudomonadota bacterium]